MNEIELESFPFNSIVDDREYEAEIFRNYFGKFLTTGVYFGLYNDYGDYSMKVVTDTGLNVKVKKGCGLIKGTDFNLKNDTTLSLEMPIGNDRNDMIVVRFDDTLEERKTKLYVKQGTSTDFPTLERTVDVYEICLAKIVVQDRSLSITVNDITDTRRDSDLCGIVTSLIDIDIQDVLDDIEAKKDQFFLDLEIETEAEKTAFFQRLEDWFVTVQNILDGDVAGNLLNLINTKADKKKVWEKTINVPTNFNVPFVRRVSGVTGITETDIAKIYPIYSEDLEIRQKQKEIYNKIGRVDTIDNAVRITFDETNDTDLTELTIRIEVDY